MTHERSGLVLVSPERGVEKWLKRYHSIEAARAVAHMADCYTVISPLTVTDSPLGLAARKPRNKPFDIQLIEYTPKIESDEDGWHILQRKREIDARLHEMNMSSGLSDTVSVGHVSMTTSAWGDRDAKGTNKVPQAFGTPAEEQIEIWCKDNRIKLYGFLPKVYSMEETFEYPLAAD